METEKLYDLARKYVWWKSPGDALGDKNHFIAQVMTYGVIEDCFRLLKYLGEADFIAALKNPPIGVFNGRSWHFWHYKLKLAGDADEVPPLPVRQI